MNKLTLFVEKQISSRSTFPYKFKLLNFKFMEKYPDKGSSSRIISKQIHFILSVLIQPVSVQIFKCLTFRVKFFSAVKLLWNKLFSLEQQNTIP